jgi:hypothetical protein
LKSITQRGLQRCALKQSEPGAVHENLPCRRGDMATAHGPSATARGQDAFVDSRRCVRDRDVGRLGTGLGTTAQGPRGH